MSASRSAVVPHLVAVALIGLGAAGCSDSSRFSSPYFGSGYSSRGDNYSSRGEVTGSIPQQQSTPIESRPLPRLASNGEGVSGGGRGMGSYEPRKSEVTGSLPPPPPPEWTWEGGTPVTVRPGDTPETLSRRYHVPVAAIMRANGLGFETRLRPGEHLVIPRRRGPAYAMSAPRTRIASNAPALPAAEPLRAPRTEPSRRGGVHVVAPGETLHSIARLYGKPVTEIARANNIPGDSMLRIGQHIIIPGARETVGPERAAPRAQAPAAAVPPPGPDLATADSPHSARVVETMEQAGEKTKSRSAQATGAVPSFRWPVRGHIIAGFGPKPNGLQNDGINLAVPEGTPIKAAEDGVVAYAGNELKGYGNLVLLRHANGFVTAYANASEILVKRGDQVKRGQVIARSGETGNVTSPQLHFEIRKGSVPVDPALYLKGA